MADLKDVTRAFGRGEATLESLRAAARGELYDRQLAGEIIRLISDWENSAWKDSARSRGDLRANIKALVPPAPTVASPGLTSRRKPRESIYEAGLRGQRRRP